MRLEEMAELVLKCHMNDVGSCEDLDGHVLESHLNHSGLMSEGGFKGWKKKKQGNRPKVGAFNLKVFRLIGD